jgi:hypothetical protein
VDVLTCLEHIDKDLIAGEMRHHPQLDLRVVRR